MQRRFDLVLWGASGFTGKLTAEYILRRHRGQGARIALAGRNEAKLNAIRHELSTIDHAAQRWGLLVGNSHDRESLDTIATQTAVVCSTVGPYSKLGSELVAACAEAGTDYCDLTGEPNFVRRMIDRHHERARATGARIVHCCGFDSIPSDLGTWMMVTEAKERFGIQLEEVKLITGRMKGGVSGGSVASMLAVLDEVAADRSALKVLANPYGLNPAGERSGPDTGDQKSVRYDPDLPGWTAPFVMAPINTRVVRRSNALLGYPYGRDFRYSECAGTGQGVRGLTRAVSWTAGIAAVLAGASWGPLRRLLLAGTPAAGEGPDAAARAAGEFVVHLIGKGRDASGAWVGVRGRVEGESDPGYGETAKMLAESALCLAEDGRGQDRAGGIGTPAATLGAPLLQRLRQQGMGFTVTRSEDSKAGAS